MKKLLRFLRNGDYYEVVVDGNRITRCTFTFGDSLISRELTFDDLPLEVKEHVFQQISEDDHPTHS